MPKRLEIVIETFLNAKGHQNPINGSKVTAVLLKGWILPFGGASAVKGLQSMWLPRLVFFLIREKIIEVSLVKVKKTGESV